MHSSELIHHLLFPLLSDIYNGAKNDNNPTSTNRNRHEWVRRGIRIEIVSGFYVDGRNYGKTSKVFLWINPGAHSDHVVQIRPNTARKWIEKKVVRNWLQNGWFTSTSVNDAQRLWKREFELADIPSGEFYQRSCYGRHKQSYVFAGAIVPILNKMFKAAGLGHGDKWSKPYRVVRVDVSGNADDADNADDAEKEKTARDDESSDSEEEQEERGAPKKKVVVDPVEGGKEDVGEGVARLSDKVGSSVFRGVITKYKDDDMHESCDPSGTFFTKFSDGTKLKMDADQVNKARKLFAKETNKLVSAGVPLVDASNSLEQFTEAGRNYRGNVRRPLLSEGEDEDPENHEAIYEDEFLGETPDMCVGLMFDNKVVHCKDALNNEIEVPLHEKILMNLSMEAFSEGVASARTLHNLEKLDRLKERDGQFKFDGADDDDKDLL